MTVTSNTELILKALVDERHNRMAPGMRLDEYFEVFVSDVILSENLASLEEVMAGVVGGGGDGGIDGFYLYVNGSQVSSIEDVPASVPHGANIELLLIQAKNQARFGEDPIRKFETTTGHLLEFSNPVDMYRTLYSGALLEAADRFRKTYERCMTAFPVLLIRCIYASRGDSEAIHPAVRERAKFLERNLEKRFPNCTCRAEFVGAKELLERAKRGSHEILQLPLAETAISTTRGGYVALVDLHDYFHFMLDGDGLLRKNLFDYNVRDYEGPTVQVNKAIRDTLERQNGDDDFWWLNNGVSIVADNVSLVGKTLNLQRPRIVNGLQTSMELAGFFRRNERPPDSHVFDDRKILVRVVKPVSEESRDSIIRATNSQTLIPGIALNSTDLVHSQIEDYFCQFDLWYERRQNKYKNEGRPVNRIVTIPSLAEAVLAVVHGEPHLGNPRLGGRFLRDEVVYKKVFDTNYDLRMYRNSIEIVHAVDRYLDTLRRSERSEYGKLTHVAAAVIASTIAGRWPAGPAAVVSIDTDEIKPSSIDPLFRALRIELDEAQRVLGVEDRDSKSVADQLLEAIRVRFGMDG